VALIHAYSKNNIGDGFLVSQSAAIVREALGCDVEFTLYALRPDTFGSFSGEVVGGGARSRLLAAGVLAKSLGRIPRFDLVIGVGGGYLRAIGATQTVKASLAHVPQLFMASLTGSPTLYLPQSVGPLPKWTRALVTVLLRRIQHVYVRDDRSMAELGSWAQRMPDLALLALSEIGRKPRETSQTPVLTVRAVSDDSDSRVTHLARSLGAFDGFIQSNTGRNMDEKPMKQLSPKKLLTLDELYIKPQMSRIVVAVRMHAALLSILAGHYSIHLAYERKGFGAFQDLGLPQYVHSVRSFDPVLVKDQVQQLITSQGARDEYDAAIRDALPGLHAKRQELVTRIRELAGHQRRV
jgi:polysaccharide pyruvyl transferase WcaK-like protein